MFHINPEKFLGVSAFLNHSSSIYFYNYHLSPWLQSFYICSIKNHLLNGLLASTFNLQHTQQREKALLKNVCSIMLTSFQAIPLNYHCTLLTTVLNNNFPIVILYLIKLVIPSRAFITIQNNLFIIVFHWSCFYY